MSTVLSTEVKPKPELVSMVSARWRASSQHLEQQFARFIRLTVLAAIPSVASLIAGGKFDWRTLLAFVLPFAEVAFRQVFPALTAAAADLAPGMTIVGEPVAPASTLNSPMTFVTETTGPSWTSGAIAMNSSAAVPAKKAPAKKTVAKKVPAKKTTPPKA